MSVQVIAISFIRRRAGSSVEFASFATCGKYPGGGTERPRTRAAAQATGRSVDTCRPRLGRDAPKGHRSAVPGSALGPVRGWSPATLPRVFLQDAMPEGSAAQNSVQ
jgi:hypothetical protein